MKADPRDRITSAKTRGGARRRWAPLLLALLAALAMATGIAFYLNRDSRYAIASEVVARLDRDAQMSARRLVKEPCNRTLEADLVGALQDRAEYAAIIAFVQQAKEKCGPNEELLTDLFFAQTGSSDFGGAERTASQLVAQFPAEPHAFELRAQVREKRGDVVGAYVDMRTALSLFPDPLNVGLSIYDFAARLAEKTGHPCDAVATLRDYIAFDPGAAPHPETHHLKCEIGNRAAHVRPCRGMGTAFASRFSP